MKISAKLVQRALLEIRRFLAILLLTTQVAAFAAEGAYRELTDGELASLRGRFVPTENVHVFFGIKMESQWLAENGDVYRAGMHFAMDSTRPAPVFGAYRVVNAQHSSSTPTSSTVASGGLDSVEGVLQSNQVAGVGNTAFNSARLRVSDDARDSDSFLDADSQSVGTVGGAAAAVPVGVVVESGRLGVSIDTPQGSARQGIFGNQLTQSIAIEGNFNAVQQDLELMLITGGGTLAGSVPLHNAVGEALQLR